WADSDVSIGTNEPDHKPRAIKASEYRIFFRIRRHHIASVIEFARNLLNPRIHTQTRRDDAEADNLRRDSRRFWRDRGMGRERTDRERAARDHTRSRAQA